MTENAVNTAVTSASSPAIPAETSAVPPATRAANRPLGTPLGKHPTRVLFLGAGELGKEVTLELMRLGAWVCAADSYAGAPAAGSLEELRAGASEVGYPCVVKPVMSSSGHGQSVVRSADAIDAAWTEAQEGRRAADEGDVSRVIVEALAPLERELTVLTVSSSAGIVTCAPIGQRQESGDYRESWQPATEPDGEAERACDIARAAVEGLVARARATGETGWGVFGVELFVLTDGSILFNEVSPRPHDTGMVTMTSQRLSEFALHARVILGLPITPEHVALTLPAGTVAASHAIVVAGDGEAEFTDVAAALAEPGTDLRIFAKPEV
ncbi:MAG: ATP-grasp domain-containing protein, partial [Bifidobacterium longum]|nr:ATP-grasp domain-containing protein [Bifidobacterium longum]